MSSLPPIRIILAKVGLDGHDRGIKVVARGLRDAGLHVIYAGLWLTPEAVVRTAVDEDADWLGLSLLSGAHMTLVPRVLQLLREAGRPDCGVIVGGIVPETDIPKLLDLGVARVFTPGTTIQEIVEYVRNKSEVGSRKSEVQTQGGDRRTLARLLTLAANGQVLPSLEPPTSNIRHPTSDMLTIALTGSGGVGKSTLIGRLIEKIRTSEVGSRKSEVKNKSLPLLTSDFRLPTSDCPRVAVLACDPQSPISGGALLGDRLRMPTRPDDDGVFIRSLATPSGQGAIAEHLPTMLRLLEAFGFDVVLIETVGAGQGDTAVRDPADVVVLLVQPETGDDLQWEKAGILEVADIIAVHKADLPGAERTAASVRAALDLPGARSIPVLLVSAKTGSGVEELWQTIVACTASPEKMPKRT